MYDVAEDAGTRGVAERLPAANVRAQPTAFGGYGSSGCSPDSDRLTARIARSSRR
jgi:hypothetical protein